MKRYLLPLALFLGISSAFAQEAPYIELTNDHLRIFVTQTEQEMGRFAVDTTQGDPARDDDNNKPLIYGRPVPWTSYTTIKVDDKNYVFGGPTTRRAGSQGLWVKMIAAPHRDGAEIVTVFEYEGLLVEQRIGPTVNPYSGWNDTARIRYRIQNPTNAEKTVGLRVVLDTMLGANDGAPFRIAGQNILSQTEFAGKDLPDIWQAFDSLASPSVIAQGVLKKYGASTPDRVILTDWGTAADHLWHIPLEAGKDFTRAGEDEADTAIVLYWNVEKLPSKASRDITILYGLGGVSLAPGASFLGIAAPSEIIYDPVEERHYQILTYIENNTPRLAHNVRVELQLPAGLSLLDKAGSVVIPQMEPKETRQMLWTIKANGKAFGKTEIGLKVTGDDLKANQLKRNVEIIGPPTLQAEFKPFSVSGWKGEPLRLEGRVFNTGGSTARDIWVNLELTPGIRLADGETSRKYVEDLPAGKEAQVHWWIIPETPGKVGVAMTGSHRGGTKKLATTTLNLPVMEGALKLTSLPSVSPGKAFCLEILGERLPPLAKFSMDLHYDPSHFKVLRIARGRFGINDQEARWIPGTDDPVVGVVRGITAERKEPLREGKYSLVRIFLVALRPGESRIAIENLQFQPTLSGRLPVYSPSITIKIKEEKE